MSDEAATFRDLAGAARQIAKDASAYEPYEDFAGVTVTSLADLREPFPPGQVGQLPKGGRTLDYVGHGAVTARLLDVDPEWNWEPLAFDESGRPAFERDDAFRPIGLWIRLTVLGVTRLGFGSCFSGQNDAEKVLIGDALRNAAMRFGVALDLWVRGHAEDDERVTGDDNRGAPASPRSGPPECVVCQEPIVAPKKAKKHGEGWVHDPLCQEPATNPG